VATEARDQPDRLKSLAASDMPALAAVLAIDVSPRWFRRHTCLVGRPTPEQRVMATVYERLSDLLEHIVDETDLPPPMTAESDHLDRLQLADLAGQWLGLVGMFGDLCVLEAALTLRRRGFRPIILEDACLWSHRLGVLLDPTSGRRARDLSRVARGRAVALFPGLLTYSDAALWTPPWLAAIGL
jgi:hypothetical protein